MTVDDSTRAIDVEDIDVLFSFGLESCAGRIGEPARE
jgi:hypothetical protein